MPVRARIGRSVDPKAAPQDPSLRLEVRLDERVLASYTDVNLDPEDLPKAVVNSFVFSPERLFVSGAAGITVAPPELVGGEIRLPLTLPAELAGMVADYTLDRKFAVDGERGEPELHEFAVDV